MTQDEIIEMTRQAGIKRRTDEFYSEFCDGVYFDDLETFAKLVRENEREEILDLVDGYAKNNTDLADAIRARGQA
jgi:hypothetical protein